MTEISLFLSGLAVGIVVGAGAFVFGCLAARRWGIF